LSPLGPGKLIRTWGSVDLDVECAIEMKLIGIVILSVASIAVLLGAVLPVIVTRVLGLGIDIPRYWGRTGTVYGPLSYPWVSLVAGLILLSVFGWGIWKLTR
jgi:hypothetical protein